MKATFILMVLWMSSGTIYSQVTFDNKTANEILDSLHSRADWEGMYRMRTAQWILAGNRIADGDTLLMECQAKCDTVVDELLRENRAAIYEIDELEESQRRVPWIVVLSTLIGVVAGMVIAQ